MAEEEVSVGRRAVETGSVKVTKRVRTEPVRLAQALRAEVVSVERVPVDRWVEAAPAPHADGDTWVVPVVEEVLVIERRLRVVEEVRITRHTHERTEVVETERRIEEVEVERDGAPAAAPASRR